MREPVISWEGPTFQGSGAMTGQWQYFVRFAGCSVASCRIRDICDEQESLKFNGSTVSVVDIVTRALEEVGRGGWLHVTGGEACDQPVALSRLVAEAKKRGLRVQLQTSGERAVNDQFDFITVSPKCSVHNLALKDCNELILSYDPESLNSIGVLRGYWNSVNAHHFYIQPVWHSTHIGPFGQEGMQNVEGCIDILRRANRCGMNWRLTTQMHKWVNIK